MKSIRRHATAVVCGTMLIGATSAATLTTQGGNPLDLVLSKLEQIIATLTPPPSPVTLATPALFGAGTISCNAANVGPESIEINIRIKNSDESRGLGSLGVVPAGKSRSTRIDGSFDLWRCEFRYEGTPAMVRANLQIDDALDRGTVSAEAR